ncbi:MAG: ATP-dependent DNA ligase [Candidatus Thorarchaeota archaeon]
MRTGDANLMYNRLAQTYEQIESTSGSIAKIQIFSELLKESSSTVIGNLISLTIGKLFPDWMGYPELGIAEKIAVQVVANAASISEKDVLKVLRRTGDIGETAEELLGSGGQMSLMPQEASVESVFETLTAISRASGSGSNRQKVSKLVGLLIDVEPIEAKYILRTVTGSLRLGLGDMGILDALSIAFTGSKEARGEIEKAFNVCSDLSKVAKMLAKDGIDSVGLVKAEVGIPIRMMAAKKLSEVTEIIDKAGGKAFVEYKYDGERVQVHKNGDEVVLFSRRQENITNQYPDVVEYVLAYVKAESCILEGECIAINPESGGMRPFQELMRRRRKTGIEEMRKEIPVVIRFFDILFLNGLDITNETLLNRREKMDEIITECDEVGLTIGELVEKPEHLTEIFEHALETGHEGVIAKAVHDKAVYQAGSRSWLWIKLKASYVEGMTDSVDLVIVGAIFGRGKRTGLYGTILASAYDMISDTYPTVCKIGTGFTDEMLVEVKERLDPHIITQMNPRVLSDVKADVWFEPIEVVEVLGDEITVSPTHHAGRGRIETGGLAIRFPRFTGRWREDKDPTQATTVSDLIEMFENQSLRK